MKYTKNYKNFLFDKIFELWDSDWENPNPPLPGAPLFNRNFSQNKNQLQLTTKHVNFLHKFLINVEPHSLIDIIKYWNTKIKNGILKFDGTFVSDSDSHEVFGNEDVIYPETLDLLIDAHKNKNKYDVVVDMKRVQFAPHGPVTKKQLEQLQYIDAYIGKVIAVNGRHVQTYWQEDFYIDKSIKEIKWLPEFWDIILYIDHDVDIDFKLKKDSSHDFSFHIANNKYLTDDIIKNLYDANTTKHSTENYICDCMSVKLSKDALEEEYSTIDEMPIRYNPFENLNKREPLLDAKLLKALKTLGVDPSFGAYTKDDLNKFKN